jgi:hypothetical protein
MKNFLYMIEDPACFSMESGIVSGFDRACNMAKCDEYHEQAKGTGALNT